MVRGERKVELYVLVGLHWAVQAWMWAFPVVNLNDRDTTPWFGLCWFMRDSPAARCALVPLNVPIRIVWFVCCWLRAPFPKAWQDDD